jgi:2-polyprenyl-6-methoxyphenol hydroxylase-like FAD-dependent oxidoreductase
VRVLISGAGISGLTAAYWFEQSGHAAIVVEKAPAPRGEGYMIDFFSSGYDVAELMGILPDLEQLHYPISRLSFVKQNGEERFSIDYAALRKLFDDRHYNFMRGDLERVLLEEIRERVELRFGTTISGIRQSKDRVEATLSDGTVESVDLAIAADGLHSHLRALVLGDSNEFERFLGYASMAFIVDPIARLEPDAFYTLTEPHRQVSVYPIRGGKLATLFLHRTDDRISNMTPDQARSRLYDVYGAMGWVVPEVLKGADHPSFFFDDVTQVKAPVWSQGRVVLLGDACWCVSLLAGQGASLAMAGAYVLAREVSRNTENLAAALASYQRQLESAIDEKQRAGRRMARWFVPDNRWQLWLRDMGARMTAWPVARHFVRKGLAPQTVL